MMKPQDIKKIGPEHQDLKRKFIIEMEEQEPHIDPDLVEGTATAFVLTDKSEGAFLTLRNWILLAESINDNEDTPYIPLIASKSEKSKILSDYSRWISRNSNLSKDILDIMQADEQKIIDKFVKTNLSTDLYDLIKEWEVQTFHTYTIDKKQHVIQFVKQYNF